MDQRRWSCVIVAAWAIALIAALSPAAAQDRCLAVANAPPHAATVQPAGFRVAQLQSSQVRITFIGHSTFLIESAKGVKIATDYNDYYRPREVPDIATMNRAHDTHFSYRPDPGIRFLLPGWNPQGGPAQHDVTYSDVRVRNVPTNIRNWSGGTFEYGNSIFVFEVAGLCIAHLGHLHHTLTVQQLGQIGQMDVVLVPVDGSFTLDLDGMIEVLQALKAPLIIPMHYFSSATLERFLARVRDSFEVVRHGVPTIVVSRESLPRQPQVLVLPGP